MLSHNKCKQLSKRHCAAPPPTYMDRINVGLVFLTSVKAFPARYRAETQYIACCSYKDVSNVHIVEAADKLM